MIVVWLVTLLLASADYGCFGWRGARHTRTCPFSSRHPSFFWHLFGSSVQIPKNMY